MMNIRCTVGGYSGTIVQFLVSKGSMSFDRVVAIVVLDNGRIVAKELQDINTGNDGPEELMGG